MYPFEMWWFEAQLCIFNNSLQQPLRASLGIWIAIGSLAFGNCAVRMQVQRARGALNSITSDLAQNRALWVQET